MQVFYEKSVMNMIMDVSTEAHRLGKQVCYVKLDDHEWNQLAIELKRTEMPRSARLAIRKPQDGELAPHLYGIKLR